MQVNVPRTIGILRDVLLDLLISYVTIGFLVIEFFHAYASKNTIFHVENLVQQSVNATSSPSVTRKQLLLVLNCNSHLSCPFV